MTINSDIAEIATFLQNLKKDGCKIISQPLGFYRIFLTAKDALSAGLLLHIWTRPNQHRKSKEIDIHSHTFDMTSRVLCGSLINRLYQVNQNESGNYKLVNVFHDGKKATRVVTDTLVEPTIIKEEIVDSGNIYTFGSKIFHSTEIVNYPTITLMEKTNMIPDNAVNIIKSDYAENEVGTYQQPDFDQEEIWKIIFDKLEKQTK
jgi:hypothetical protein